MKLMLSLDKSEKVVPLSVSSLNTKSRAMSLLFEENRKPYVDVFLKDSSNSKYSILGLDTPHQNKDEIICEFEGPAYIMSFMKKGCMKCMASSIKNTLNEKQNNIFCIRGNTKCCLREANCFYIILSEAYMKNLSLLYPETTCSLSVAMDEGTFFAFGPAHLHTTLEMERVIKEIENLDTIKSGKDMYTDTKIKELLWMQINHHLKIKDEYNPTLEKYREQMLQACQFIENNIRKDITLPEVSKHAGVCETILKIAFKYFHGKTVFTYLNECRMQNACRLLRDSSYSISEVALMSGYEHSSYFSTAFKQKHGITPLEYRKLSG